MRPSAEEPQITRLLSKYNNISATTKDVIDALENYPSLSYNLEKFVFNDGSFKDLFTLNGTIPVYFKGNRYYIPICIWLMDTHPNNAPMCYVKPTKNMQIKVSMYVDHTGRIYLPYLHEWQPQSSDLLGLIQVMIVTFGEHPPVYSKPSREQTTPYPTQSVMPQPATFLPYPASGGAFPPYPPTNNYGSYPYPQINSGQTPPQSSGTSYPAYPMPTGSGYNSNYNANQSGTGTITEEHIKASLISAVEDKLRRRIQERVNQCHAEIQTLKRTKQELTEGRSKIDAIMNKLEKEEIELKKNIAVLRDKEQELEKSLESLEKVDGIDVDEAVITTAPLYRQLLNAYAEEAATEDAIYYLGEALRGGVIDLEVFLKHVRQLSRRQFMLRAIMQKCRQKAGLAC